MSKDRRIRSGSLAALPRSRLAGPAECRFDRAGEGAPRDCFLDTLLPGRHNCGVTTEPLRTVRDHLSEIVDRVEREHDRVVITKNGREAAVLLSATDLAELEETLSVLSDAAAMADIREADAAYVKGEVIRGVDAVRALRP
jgi:antitoxin YefM